jgi:peptidoglycan hydrolase CwlO-like protein
MDHLPPPSEHIVHYVEGKITTARTDLEGKIEMVYEEVISTRLDLENKIEVTAGRLEKKMEGLDSRVDHLDKKVDDLDKKVDHLDKKVDHLEKKVDHLDKKVDHLDKKVDDLDKKVDHLDKKVEATAEGLMNYMKVEFDAIRGDIASAVGTVEERSRDHIAFLMEKFDHDLHKRDQALASHISDKSVHLQPQPLPSPRRISVAKKSSKTRLAKRPSTNRPRKKASP